MSLALLKGPINQFKPVQQSGKKVIRACCPNIYTVNERESTKGHILLTFVSEQWAMNQPKNLTNLHFDRI
jgi:hypothetical protein